MDKHRVPLAPTSPPPITARSAGPFSHPFSCKLPQAFVYCLDDIHVSQLPAFCGLRLALRHGPVCAPVNGRHDLLAKHAASTAQQHH